MLQHFICRDVLVSSYDVVLDPSKLFNVSTLVAPVSLADPTKGLCCERLHAAASLKEQSVVL